MDVFKALALGADAVLICRPFVPMVYGGAEEGVKLYIEKIGAELSDTLSLIHIYTELVAAAKAITDDMDARYTAFAKAEAFLLDHAFAVPFSISNRSYQMCNLNVFEGQYASFGLANQRYKDQHLYSSSMGMEEYQAAYAEWRCV